MEGEIMYELIDWADVLAIGLLARTLYYDLVHCDAIAEVLRKVEAQVYQDGFNDGGKLTNNSSGNKS
jgi:hypothetical protein